MAPKLLGISVLEAAIMGAVLAAVSPAVVVPRMVKLMEEGRGADKNIPQLILAGASADDVYVIVLFTTFIGMIQGDGVSIMRFVNIPISIALGIIVGLFTGRILAVYFEKVHLTVQAAIGGIPLSLGLACGGIVLTIAVLAIVITAPLGAFAIDSTYKKLLS